MDTVCQRFLQAEQDFVLAAQYDDHRLGDFADCWQTLQSDWDSLHLEADPNTRQLVGMVAARIEELSGDIYLVKSRTLSLEDDLLSGLEDVFASLTLEDCVVAHTEPTSGTVMSAQLPPPDHPAISPSRWLLRNLHNPYPLPHIQFSQRAVGSKHMKDWFAKARQRIGWTRLLRDRFSGCRSLAIDAAFRAFVRDDPANPLDTDLKTAFLAIKSHAELVYDDEEATSPSPSKRPRSISPTPSLSFSSGSEDSDDEQCPIPSPEVTFHRPSKRGSPDSSPDSRSPKRRRAREFPTSPELQTRATISPTHPKSPSLPPKKRRLSESDSDNSRPKRPRGIPDVRLYAVSDPPAAPTVPTWFDFDKSFQIPNPASTGPPDSSPFDLDFFNPLSLPSCAASCVPAPSANFTIPVDDFSLFEIPQLDLSQPGLPITDSDWMEFLNFEPSLSLFPNSPSPASSLASTPPLVDDATLSSSSLSDSYPSSPALLLNVLPYLNEKGSQFPTLGEPTIQGQDFLLPPGENSGIPSVTALLSVH